jgi:hypothetical protein
MYMYLFSAQKSLRFWFKELSAGISRANGTTLSVVFRRPGKERWVAKLEVWVA